MDHPELESALWASVAAGVKALEHTAKAADFQSLCEGLARLTRIIRSLLHRAACSAGQTQQHLERRVSARPAGGGGRLWWGSSFSGWRLWPVGFFTLRSVDKTVVLFPTALLVSPLCLVSPILASPRQSARR